MNQASSHSKKSTSYFLSLHRYVCSMYQCINQCINLSIHPLYSTLFLYGPNAIKTAAGKNTTTAPTTFIRNRKKIPRKLLNSNRNRINSSTIKRKSTKAPLQFHHVQRIQFGLEEIIGEFIVRAPRFLGNVFFSILDDSSDDLVLF